MTTTATRSSDLNATEPRLYMALDLGEKAWELGFTVGLGQPARRRRVQAGNREQLLKEVGRAKKRFGLPEGAEVLSCYEAGGEAFWVHRFLEGLGVGNVVVDSASILVERRRRRAKSDRLDVQKLAPMLFRYHNGERKVWRVVRVPGEEAEDQRHLQRSLVRSKAERNRVASRIRGLLKTQGVDLARVRIVRLAEEDLARLRGWKRKALPPGLQGRLGVEVQRLQLTLGQIRSQKKERAELLKHGSDARVKIVRQLMLLKGIGINGGFTLSNELFAWRTFSNRKEVGGSAGLTPTPFNTGGSPREQGIGKDGNSLVRALMIELAWGWLRWQPQSGLSLWFEGRFGPAGKRARKIGIVAVARKLLIQLWRFVETGEVPPGAKLKLKLEN